MPIEDSFSEELMVVESTIKGKKKINKKTEKKKVIDYREVRKDSSDEECVVIDSKNFNSEIKEKSITIKDKKEMKLNDPSKDSLKDPSKDSKITKKSKNNFCEIDKIFDNAFEINNNLFGDLFSGSKPMGQSNANKIEVKNSIEPANDCKYTIKFKDGSFESIFYLNGNDPVESIYVTLFGNETDRKLIYEEMKLSRFLTADEAGFFPGINYIYLPPGEHLSPVLELFFTVKIDEKEENDILMKNNYNSTVSDVMKCLEEMEIETLNKSLVFNGEILDSKRVLKDFIENDYSLDLIDNSVFNNFKALK